LRLDPRFLFTLYATFSVLFVTGAGWLLADQLKEAPGTGDAWQTTAAYLLMLHGGTAMMTLMLLGAVARAACLAKPEKSSDRAGHADVQWRAHSDFIRALLCGIRSGATVDKRHSYWPGAVPACSILCPRLGW
jgi:hypothetical protein